MIVFLYDWIIHIEQQLNSPPQTAFLISLTLVPTINKQRAKAK